MTIAARPAWSAGQRDRLAAMGLVPYVRADAPPPQTDASTVEVVPSDEPLLRALLRAAGIRTDGPDAESVRAHLPPLETLRGNPAAKRALWPRLRALRRDRRG